MPPIIDVSARNEEISRFIYLNRMRQRLTIRDAATLADLSVEEAYRIETLPAHVPLCDLAKYIEGIDPKICGNLSLVISGLVIPLLDAPEPNQPTT